MTKRPPGAGADGPAPWRAGPMRDALWLGAGAGAAAALCGSALSAVAAALWWLAVLVVVRSDLASFTIPDGASLAIGGLGLLHAGASSLAAGDPPAEAGAEVLWAMVNGGAGFFLFWVVARLYRAARGRDGLGFGDVKLAAASAVWLTAAEGAMALEISALGALALLLRRGRLAPVRDVAVPFGAFMAPAAWLVFVLRADLRPFLDGAW